LRNYFEIQKGMSSEKFVRLVLFFDYLAFFGL